MKGMWPCTGNRPRLAHGWRPLRGDASSELTPAGGGEGGLLTLLTSWTLDGIDSGQWTVDSGHCWHCWHCWQHSL